MKRGFAVTDALDDAFARGWPELYVLDDAPEGAGIPREAGGRRWVWSRAEAEARVTERNPIVFAREAMRRGYKPDDILFFECVVGAEPLADGIACALEELADREWKRLHIAKHLVAWLDVLLRRVGAEAADAIAARIDAVLAKHEATRPAPLAEATTERFRTYDRRNAARLAYLGADLELVFDRWFLCGDANAQSYFLATAGQIAGAAVEAAIRDGAYLSRIPGEALAWLAARNVAPPPKPEVPPAADLATTAHTGDGDEFGFVFLPPAAAAQLVGEDDHTRLCAGVDPISLEPNAVEIYGAKGFLFCRTYDVGRCLTADGAFLAYAGSEDDVRAAFEAAAERRWMPLTTVEGPLIGLPASWTLADATRDGHTFDLPVPAGTYDVFTAIQDEDTLPLLWLRRRRP